MKSKKQLESLQGEVFNLPEAESILINGGATWGEIYHGISGGVKKVTPQHYCVTNDSGTKVCIEILG